jgi:hypothetical protein
VEKLSRPPTIPSTDEQKDWRAGTCLMRTQRDTEAIRLPRLSRLDVLQDGFDVAVVKPRWKYRGSEYDSTLGHNPSTPRTGLEGVRQQQCPSRVADDISWGFLRCGENTYALNL